MHRDANRYRTFSRRSVLLFSGKLTLLSGLIGRMYYLQIIEGEKYKTLADENRISLQLIAPKRGRILDRFGRPMAINRQNYRVMLVPENTNDIELSLRQLGKIIPLSTQDIIRIKRKLKRKRRFLPLMVKENLKWNDLAKIEVNEVSAPAVTTLVPPTVIASASTVPSKYASLNSKASVPRSTIAFVPGVKAPSVNISCFSFPA